LRRHLRCSAFKAWQVSGETINTLYITQDISPEAFIHRPAGVSSGSDLMTNVVGTPFTFIHATLPRTAYAFSSWVGACSDDGAYFRFDPKAIGASGQSSTATWSVAGEIDAYKIR
jgi:hypothetical protein